MPSSDVQHKSLWKAGVIIPFLQQGKWTLEDFVENPHPTNGSARFGLCLKIPSRELQGRRYRLGAVQEVVSHSTGSGRVGTRAIPGQGPHQWFHRGLKLVAHRRVPFHRSFNKLV